MQISSHTISKKPEKSKNFKRHKSLQNQFIYSHLSILRSIYRVWELKKRRICRLIKKRKISCLILYFYCYLWLTPNIWDTFLTVSLEENVGEKPRRVVCVKLGVQAMSHWDKKIFWHEIKTFITFLSTYASDNVVKS